MKTIKVASEVSQQVIECAADPADILFFAAREPARPHVADPAARAFLADGAGLELRRPVYAGFHFVFFGPFDYLLGNFTRNLDRFHCPSITAKPK